MWWKRWVRRHGPIISGPVALKWHNRLNLMYIFCAFNLFGIMAYKWMTKGYKDKDMSTAEAWFDLAKGDQNPTVISIKGLSSYSIREGKRSVPVGESDEKDLKDMPKEA